MPKNTPTAAATEAPAVPSIRFSDPTPRERLARLVLDSPRLLAVIPAEELLPLFTAYRAATEAVTAARLLPTEGADVRAEVTTALRRGEKIDPADLMARIGAAQVAQDNRDRTVALLAAMPAAYRDEIVGVLDDYSDDYWTALGEHLSELLDEAASVVSALAGIDSADAAIDAGKSEDWAALKGLVRDYAALRREHAALVRLEDNSTNFASGSPGLARTYFAGLDTAAPDFTDQASGQRRDLSGRLDPAPSWVLDVNSTAHLLAAVRQRAQLRPHVGRPSGASATEPEDGPVSRDGIAVPTVRDPQSGRLVAWHGSEANVMAATFGDRGSSPSTRDYMRAHADD